jgi:hypothetical protein
MRILRWLGVLAPFLAGTAVAQVTAEVVLEQDQFLSGEATLVGVRITNFSGQVLRLGRDNDWLRLLVEGKDGYLVPRRGEVPVQGDFDLETSTIATKRVDITPWFVIERPGRYQVTAVVRLPGWDREITTKPKPFDVIQGTVLWEQDFGIPTPSDVNRPPEVRRYMLQQAIHLKQMKLYVRVADPRGERIYGMFPLGPVTTFSQPEHQIDRQSNLHVLYQTGARSFNYSLINPDGKLVARQTYEYTESRPVLRSDPQGQIVVSGGVRRLSRDDLPPAEVKGGATNEVVSPKA